MPGLEHIDNTTHDLSLGLSNLAEVDNRIRTVLAKNNILVVENDIIFDNWNPDVNNCQVAIINYDDIIWFSEWIDDLKTVANKYNIKFSLITNIVYLGNNNNSEYKVLFYKELFGVFYNPAITQTPKETSKLFTCLLQRTTYPRLKLFSELLKNNLLSRGNVSLLGYQINADMSPNDIVRSIANNFDEFDYVINRCEFPYRNFKELGDSYKIEEQGKYTIVAETYNDFIDSDWVSFTEKTFRSIQIPNIAVVLNKKGSVGILKELGIELHPINHVLDYMSSYNSQTNFLVGLLHSDICDVLLDIAKRNQEQMQSWSNTLNTDGFYQTIINDLL